MNFLNLEYFVVAAEELNFTKAARKLFISQQSLSNHIAKLEAYCSVELFDRTPPMTLTSAGVSLLQSARTILSAKEQAEQKIQDIKDFKSGDITIGISRARGTVILPALLSEFHRRFPHVRLHLYEGTALEAEDALLKGKVDVVIGFISERPNVLTSEVLMEEQFVVVVPKQILSEYFDDQGAALLSQQDTPVDIRMFQNCPFVTISSSTYAGYMFQRCCEETGFVPDVVLETISVLTLVSLCLAGLGVVVCPEIFIRNRDCLPNGNKIDDVEIFYLDYPPARRSTAITYSSTKYLTKATQAFIATAKEILQN